MTRVFRAVSILSVIGILAALSMLLADYFYCIPCIEPHDTAAAGVALGFASCIVLSNRRRPFAVAMLFVSCVTLLGGAGVIFGQRLALVRYILEFRRTQPELLMPHGRYGWAMRPNLKVGHITDEFTVVYTTDEAGCRTTPKPSEPKATVVLLGCSNTFGHGVDDRHVYAYRLATEYWPEVAVINRAINGSGPVQAALIVDELAAQDTPPDAIIYAWFDDHALRTHLSRTMMATAYLLSVRYSSPKGFQMPVAEFGAVGVERLSMVDFEEGLCASDVDPGPSTAYALECIAAMQRTCDRRGIAFVLFSMAPGHDPKLARRLQAMVTNFITWDRPGEYYAVYPEDQHPLPSTHAHLADLLGTHPAIRKAIGLPPVRGDEPAV